MVLGVLLGARGLAPVVAFGLGGFAAGSAGRQIVLATRRQGWRGFIGRANGGMVVHIGVVIIAVAVAASGSFVRQAEFTLAPGESAEFAGHTLTYEGQQREAGGRQDRQPGADPHRRHRPLGPVAEPVHQRLADHRHARRCAPPRATTSPSRSSRCPRATTTRSRCVSRSSRWSIWLWIGGAVMALGTLLAVFPGRRRNPIDPVSAPLPGSRSGSSPPIRRPRSRRRPRAPRRGGSARMSVTDDTHAAPPVPPSAAATPPATPPSSSASCWSGSSPLLATRGTNEPLSSKIVGQAAPGLQRRDHRGRARSTCRPTGASGCW